MYGLSAGTKKCGRCGEVAVNYYCGGIDGDQNIGRDTRNSQHARDIYM